MIDLASASIENQYTITGTLAAGIALDGTGSVLVARGILGTQVDRVALTGGAATPIPNTSASFGITVLPGGAEALIASGDGDTIKRVSLASNSVTDAIEFASNQHPHNLAISPDGQLAVVAAVSTSACSRSRQTRCFAPSTVEAAASPLRPMANARW